MLTTTAYYGVGTGGRGLFAARYRGPDGKSVPFSGAIRVHRVGGIEDPDRHYVFECYGKEWPGGYLDDPSSAKWFDAKGNPACPVDSTGCEIATQDDLYGVIIPALKTLDGLLTARRK